jgi:hypothetical protein
MQQILLPLDFIMICLSYSERFYNDLFILFRKTLQWFVYLIPKDFIMICLCLIKKLCNATNIAAIKDISK